MTEDERRAFAAEIDKMEKRLAELRKRFTEFPSKPGPGEEKTHYVEGRAKLWDDEIPDKENKEEL